VSGAERTRLGGPLTALAGALASVSAYLLTLLAAALAASSRPVRGPAGAAAPPHFAVLVPAHDEEAQIEGTVAALARLRYDGEWETIVIADNCRDRTADAARRAGATVWERHEPDRPGKGAALAWALDRVGIERAESNAVAVVDADCLPSTNMLDAMAARIAAGARAVQVDYVVANPEESPASAVRYAAFALMNSVRPAGKSALGLSCGLLGTGMAFTPELLARVPWNAFGITEDWEHHLRLVEAGERVTFAPEASVRSPMPTSFAASEIQQERWEGGRFALALRRTPRLLLRAAAEVDPRLASAAFDVAVPPQSVLLGSNVAVVAVAAASRSRAALRLGLAALVGQVLFVLGGLAFVRAPLRVYGALALAPVLVLRKGALMLRITRGRRGGGDWVRTPRG
jgi:1,2-diacylglycerol 3-beta-glucosyltransferase